VTGCQLCTPLYGDLHPLNEFEMRQMAPQHRRIVKGELRPTARNQIDRLPDCQESPDSRTHDRFNKLEEDFEGKPQWDDYLESIEDISEWPTSALAYGAAPATSVGKHILCLQRYLPAGDATNRPSMKFLVPLNELSLRLSGSAPSIAPCLSYRTT
jgi:hypothetical protein